MPVLVVCSPGGTAFVNLSLTQRVSRDIASGFGFTSATCTGDLQIVDILVTASGKAFRKASAFASASLTACDNFGCASANDDRTIDLTNKS